VGAGGGGRRRRGAGGGEGGEGRRRGGAGRRVGGGGGGRGRGGRVRLGWGGGRRGAGPVFVWRINLVFWVARRFSRRHTASCCRLRRASGDGIAPVVEQSRDVQLLALREARVGEPPFGMRLPLGPRKRNALIAFLSLLPRRDDLGFGGDRLASVSRTGPCRPGGERRGCQKAREYRSDEAPECPLAPASGDYTDPEAGRSPNSLQLGATPPAVRVVQRVAERAAAAGQRQLRNESAIATAGGRRSRSTTHG